MRSGSARYDGHAEWYDRTFSGSLNAEAESFLRAQLGTGGGQVCLDVACGTGRCGPILADAGYRAVGLDLSADQLRFARSRLPATVRADARFLPVRDASVAAAVGMFFHTDVEDFAAVVRDVARCLRPAGRFIYLGTHPCFVGPFVYRLAERDDLALNFVPGYGTAGWADRGSGDGSMIGARVGFHHKTLEGFLGAFAAAGLAIRAAREFSAPGHVVLPWDMAVVTEKNLLTGQPAPRGTIPRRPGRALRARRS